MDWYYWGGVAVAFLILIVPLIITLRNGINMYDIKEVRILSAERRYSGGFFGAFYTEVTFMVYYNSGRTQKVRVSRDSRVCEELMEYVK